MRPATTRATSLSTRARLNQLYLPRARVGRPCKLKPAVAVVHLPRARVGRPLLSDKPPRSSSGNHVGQGPQIEAIDCRRPPLVHAQGAYIVQGGLQVGMA